eukprot:COSAG02_NODE_936_length_15800_cov_56.762945_5_plen_135_part_00
MFVVIFKKYVLSMSLSFYGREFCEIAPLTSRDGQPCLVAMMLLVWRPPPLVQSFAYQTGRQNENQTQPRNPQELRKRYHMVVSSPDRRVREALRDNAGGGGARRVPRLHGRAAKAQGHHWMQFNSFRHFKWLQL